MKQILLFEDSATDTSGINLIPFARRRRREPTFRIIRNRRHALAFVRRSETSERGHLVLLALGSVSAVFAWTIGWTGWARLMNMLTPLASERQRSA